MAVSNTDIQKLYIAYFNRPADYFGLTFQKNIAEKEGIAMAAQGFVNSPEYQAIYGNKPLGVLVESLYVNLFNRTPALVEVNYWVQEIQSGRQTTSSIALTLVNGAINQDAKTIANKLSAAEAFYNAIDTTAEANNYSGDDANLVAKAWLKTIGEDAAGLAAAIAPTALNATLAQVVEAGMPKAPVANFALSANSDTLPGTAGNDVFTAGVVLAADGTTQVATLQNIDQITGGAGTDTLNAIINSATSVAPSLSGIENVNVRSTTTASAISLAGATGVTNVTVNNSTATAVVTDVAGAALGVSNQNFNVSFDGSTSKALTLNLTAAGTAATDVTVELAATVANAATSIVINASNAHATLAETTASAATTSATVNATGVNELTFGTADLASLTTLNVTGAGSVDFTGAALSALTTVTAGDGSVKLTGTSAAAAALTATTGAGADTLTFNGANIKSLNSGAGNDSVTLNTAALAATATVTLGDGNDTLTLAAAPTGDATITAGAGTDTIASTVAVYNGISALTSAQRAKITGFEVLAITEILGNGASLDVSSLAGVGSFTAQQGVATGGAATVTKLGASSVVTLAGDAANNGSLTATLATDTAADTLTLVLNKDIADNNDVTVDELAASSTFVAANLETLNVTSTGTSVLGADPVEGYKADVIVNTLALTGSNKLTTINVSGDQEFVLTTTAAMDKLATINASANTAGVDIDAALNTIAVAITGTAKADIISGGAKGDTLTLGAGNDTVDYTGGGVSKIGTGAFDTITDFKANTFGNGTNGATGTGAAADATKWNGDVLAFNGDGGAGGAVVDVLDSAANATTFLANNAGSAAGIVAALDSSNNNLYVDNTGDGVADFFIKLTGVTTVNAATFVVV